MYFAYDVLMIFAIMLNMALAAALPQQSLV